MKDLFQFGQYTVRRVDETDRELLLQWIASDPEHAANGTTPEFFTEESLGTGCYLLSDHNGPLFFFKTENTVRLHTQFGPSDTPEDRLRNRDGLVHGMDWLAKQCAARGASEILFESRAPMLIRLAVQQMGCTRSPFEIKRELLPERLGIAFLDNWRMGPQGSRKGDR